TIERVLTIPRRAQHPDAMMLVELGDARRRRADLAADEGDAHQPDDSLPDHHCSFDGVQSRRLRLTNLRCYCRFLLRMRQWLTDHIRSLLENRLALRWR